MGGPVARPALGAAVRRVRRSRTRPRGLLAREAPGRCQRPSVRGGPGRPPARPPRRDEDDLRRGRARARRAPQQPQVRRTDRHGPDPVGRRAAADRLDRAATPGRPTRRSTRACAPVSARLRSRHAPGVRWMGGDSPARWRRGVRGSPRITDPRANTGRRRVDPHPDEATLRAAPVPTASARLLPSGDAYFLLQGKDRELLVPDAGRRSAVWTPRVWPGCILVKGEVAGTWRRAQATVTAQAWRRLSGAARDAVEAEAESLPLPGISGRIVVRWED
jgi:hypothetical protein